MRLRITICSFFSAFESKEGDKEDYGKVGESKVGGLGYISHVLEGGI